MREGMLAPENWKNNLSCGTDGAIGTPVSPEGISGWQERFWESLVAFEAVQMDHHQAFASGRCDHLLARRAEREKALACLQMALEAAQKALRADEDGDFTKRVRAKFSALIDMETALAEEVRKVRKHLLDELGALQQGKRVLKGYGQHHDASLRSMLLNHQT
jgi:hypothetical protein